MDVQTLRSEFIFFKDWLDNSKSSWLPILQKCFGERAIFEPVFTGQKKEEIKIEPEVKKEGIDISDKEKWQKANMLLDAFPGSISEVKE